MFDKKARATSSRLSQELFRYTIVGGIGFLIDFSVLTALVEFGGIHYLLAATLAFLTGVACTYVLSIRWVFAYRSNERRDIELTIFALVGVVGLLLTNLFMFLFVDVFSMLYFIAKPLVTIIVFSWNFGARKYLLFRSV